MDFQSIALPTELRNHLVAGEGFEPTTSGLWARRATRLLYPAMFNKWRRNWDSNPGASFPTYRFSRPDPSTTWVFLRVKFIGGPCRTRTYDPPVMSRMLWPTELRVQLAKLVAGVGLEPTAFRVWTGCSSQLSYPANLINGRDDRIWTCDPLIPNQVHYQAVLRPDNEWRAQQESNPQPFDP